MVSGWIPVFTLCPFLAFLGGQGEVSPTQRPLELGETGALELPDPLARDVQHSADRLERVRLAVEAVAQLQHAALPLGQFGQRLAQLTPLHRGTGSLARIVGAIVSEQLTQLRVVVAPEPLVQRNAGLDDCEGLLDVLELDAARLSQLLRRRLAAELDLEAPRVAPEGVA